MGEFEKNEFRKYFEYAFAYNPKYWADLKDWETISLGRPRTIDEEKRFVVLLNRHCK